MKIQRQLLCFFVPLALAIAVCFGLVLPLAINDELWNDSNSITSSAVESPSNTGASTADQSLKGGAIFMQPGSSTSHFDMNGGEISNSTNKYGGAIFISTGTVFTMTAGSIHDCQATYGGAIYVQAGATCTITGGSIHDCTATYGPAIFVERGAIFSCTSPDIDPSEIYNMNITLRTVPDEVIVRDADGQQLHSGAPLNINDVLEIDYAVKNDYYMSFDVNGATRQSGTTRYVVNDSVDITYTEIPATLDKLKFTLSTDHYEVSKASNDITGEVVIPNYHDGRLVTTIPKGTSSTSGTGFYSCKSITSVLIPASVTTIGNQAFASCSVLESVIVNKNNITYTSRNLSGQENNCIINISGKALISGCKATTIPEDGSVTTIGEYAFYGSTLTSINIPNNVVSIGEYAFNSCSSLSNVDLGSSVTDIGSYAFKSCSSLGSITLPDTLTSLGNYAFDSSGLTRISIPGKLSSINSGVFNNCTSLRNVTINNGTTGISVAAFMNTAITNIVLPSSISHISSGAFRNCTKLTIVQIESGEIENQAFQGCTNITNVIIGEGVTSIGFQAFYNSKINNVIIRSKAIYNAVSSSESSNGYLTAYIKSGGVIRVLMSIDDGSNSYLNNSTYFTKSTTGLNGHYTYTRK